MTDLAPLVGIELNHLADALARLSDDDWNRASLCAGWEVRHVIAHLTMPARYGGEQFQAELRADGYDFDAMSNRLAAVDGELGPGRLLADLRSSVLAGFEQPGGGWLGSLSHVVIHGLDVTMPVGLGRVASDEATGVVLRALTESGPTTMFGVDLGTVVALSAGRSVSDGEQRPA